VLGQLADVELDLRLELFEALVDLRLHGQLGLGVGHHGKQDLEVLELFVTAAGAGTGILRGVGDATVHPLVLPHPVVGEAGDVLLQRDLVVAARVLLHLAVEEAEEDALVDLFRLVLGPLRGRRHRAIELAIVAEDGENREVHQFALSHGIAPCLDYVRVGLHYDELYASFIVT